MTGIERDWKRELLSTTNSALVLVDYQPSMFAGVASGDRTIIRNAAHCASTAASTFGVPIVLSAINPQRNGEFVSEIADLSGREVITRSVPSFDALEDEQTKEAVERTGRKKMIVSGLWTSMSFTYTALHALDEGYEVYGLMDASGDSTPEAHRYGVERMLQAGVVPATVESLVSEWMHDRSIPRTGGMAGEIYSRYGAMLGIGSS